LVGLELHVEGKRIGEYMEVLETHAECEYGLYVCQVLLRVIQSDRARIRER